MKRRRRAKPQPRADLSYLRVPRTMLDGLSVRASKAKLHAMLVHAVTVAEAWQTLARDAQAQEQRSYLAFVRATHGPARGGTRD